MRIKDECSTWAVTAYCLHFSGPIKMSGPVPFYIPRNAVQRNLSVEEWGLVAASWMSIFTGFSEAAGKQTSGRCLDA